VKKLALIFVGAAAMAVVAVATSFGASATAGPRDAVWGGGHFAVTTGNQFERDLSVTAELGRFGEANGTLVYGLNGVSSRPTDSVSCLAVSGNHAVIGGYDPAQGGPFLFYLVDNGPPSSQARDQVSPLLLLDENDVAQMPTGFPKVCPSPDFVFGGFSYSDLSAGDIVVRDVS
jgi:hypothetical protein